MIINKKKKSAIVEAVMNFKKEQNSTVTNEQKIVCEDTKEDTKLQLTESNIKPSLSLLDVELEKKEKHESVNTIECSNRKEIAEQVTKLKEQHIKHKISKKDNKYFIECFNSVKEDIEDAETDDMISELRKHVEEFLIKWISRGLSRKEFLGAFESIYENIINHSELEESKKLKETWAGEDIIEDLTDRAKSLIEGGDSIEDAIHGAIDQGLIYTSDIHDLLLHYGTISDSDIISSYYDELYSDILSNLDIEESVKTKKECVKEDVVEEPKEDGMKAHLDAFVKQQEESEEHTEEVKEAKEDSLKAKIKSKIIAYLKRIGYNERDFDEYFVIEEDERINNDGDNGKHIEIRNDLVDYYEAEEAGLIAELDDIVAPGYFEPYDAYIWEAFIWDFEKEEKILESVSLDDSDIDEVDEIKVEEPTKETDDEIIYFSTEEVKDVVKDVVDEIGDEMKDKEPEEVDVEEIIDEKVADAVEEKKEEDVEDDISGLEDNHEEEIAVDFSEDDISEEDAQFYENLTISNNYKNETKSTEQQKLDEELNNVVIKDDLGVEEDISDDDMKALLGE